MRLPRLTDIDTQGNLYASAGMDQLRGTAETLDTKTGVYVMAGKTLYKVRTDVAGLPR